MLQTEIILMMKLRYEKIQEVLIIIEFRFCQYGAYIPNNLKPSDLWWRSYSNDWPADIRPGFDSGLE